MFIFIFILYILMLLVFVYYYIFIICFVTFFSCMVCKYFYCKVSFFCIHYKRVCVLIPFVYAFFSVTDQICQKSHISFKFILISCNMSHPLYYVDYYFIWYVRPSNHYQKYLHFNINNCNLFYIPNFQNLIIMYH